MISKEFRGKEEYTEIIMESFFLFSPFPVHCKFKVSFKLLAFWDPFKITTVSPWVKKTS